jgi:sentrin-specific protease 1
MLIAAFPKEEPRRIQAYDSLNHKGGAGMPQIGIVLGYLEAEWEFTHGTLFPKNDWLKITSTVDTPQQRNNFDCGIFACLFAEYVAKDMPWDFGQQQMAEARLMLALAVVEKIPITDLPQPE